MTLELNRLTNQVAAMGDTLLTRRQKLDGKGAEATAVLAKSPEVTDELRAKIKAARQVDEWRRGAVPLGERLDEVRRAGPPPPAVTLIAADGSQIYPDRHGITTYYLLNTGTIVLRQGSGEAPATESRPKIYYEDRDLYDADGQVRTAEYVSARRSRLEIEALADLAQAERLALGGDLSVPIVVVLDGPLLPWMRPEPERADAINEEIEHFVVQMARLRQARAIPVGYVDRPGSAYVLRILELVELAIELIDRKSLREGGFVGLTDRELFRDLRPLERTGLFEPNSDTNDRYEARSGDRIAFAYANFAWPTRNDPPAIARIEVPGWVARDPASLDVAQAALYRNCEPSAYPYVLARAHELAMVSQAEKANLEDLMTQVMWRNGLRPEISLKAGNKLLTGAGRK